MAEQRVLIEGMFPTGSTLPVSGSVSTTPSGTQNVNVTNTAVNAALVKNPSITGVYIFSADEIVGVAAANNYLSIFNPIGSGKSILFGGAFISSVAAGGTAITAPMRAYRATSVSGGVLQATSSSTKFITSSPDPVAEIRTGNPTATLDGAIFNSPPAISATVGSTVVHQIDIPPSVSPFLLVPGEGIVLRETTGDTDLRWNLSIGWAEM